MASFRNGSRCSDCTGETTVITRHIIKHSWRVAGSRAWQGTQRMWPGRRVPTHLVTRGARRGLNLVPERHVRRDRDRANTSSRPTTTTTGRIRKYTTTHNLRLVRPRAELGARKRGSVSDPRVQQKPPRRRLCKAC